MFTKIKRRVPEKNTWSKTTMTMHAEVTYKGYECVPT